MPNRKHSLIDFPPQPREGRLVLLRAIEGILGRETEVGRRLTRAIASEDARDLMQAQSAFDALTDDLRETINDEVRLLVEARRGPRFEIASRENVIPLRPRPPTANR